MSSQVWFWREDDGQFTPYTRQELEDRIRAEEPGLWWDMVQRLLGEHVRNGSRVVCHTEFRLQADRGAKPPTAP